jgi:hypothetical protein
MGKEIYPIVIGILLLLALGGASFNQIRNLNEGIGVKAFFVLLGIGCITGIVFILQAVIH